VPHGAIVTEISVVFEALVIQAARICARDASETLLPGRICRAFETTALIRGRGIFAVSIPLAASIGHLSGVLSR
jgi:hypothetical protein